MNVLSISTDRNIFSPESPVRQRMIEYGTLFDEMHIIVFSKKNLGLKPEKISPTVWIYPTSSRTRFSYMRNAYTVAKQIIAALKFVPENTVISTQDPFETGRVGVRLKREYGFGLQLQIHTDFLSPYFASSSFLNKMRVRMARRYLPHADEVRVVSERIQKSVVALGIKEQKIDTLPIYVDSAAVEQAVPVNLSQLYPQYSFFILMASRLEQEKGILFALDVFSTILKKYPKAGLVILGAGSLKLDIQQRARKLGIEHAIVFPGWQAEPAAWYKACHIFLSTSYYEGYGLSLAEAGIAGAAIVTSDAGIAGSVLVDGKNARVCPVNDRGCFIHALASLVESNAERDRLKRAVAEDIGSKLGGAKTEYLNKYRMFIEKACKKYVQ